MTIRILILVLCFHYSCAQEIPSVSLKIHEDSLTCVKPCSTVAVTLTFTNESDNNILVYGLKRGGPFPTFNLFRLCDVTRVATGISFAVFAPNGKQQIPEYEIVDPLKPKRVTREMVDSALRVVNTHFLASARILKKHDTITLVRQLPLKDYKLEKGLYYVQFVYYSGNYTADMLDRNKVARPAPLFQGCATSAKIPFVVR